MELLVVCQLLLCAAVLLAAWILRPRATLVDDGAIEQRLGAVALQLERIAGAVESYAGRSSNGNRYGPDSPVPNIEDFPPAGEGPAAGVRLS